MPRRLLPLLLVLTLVALVPAVAPPQGIAWAEPRHAPLLVTPPSSATSVTAQQDPLQARTKTVNVELILDSSGSMGETLPGGETRMEAAKRILRQVITDLPEREGVNVGLRVYGHEGDNTQAGKAVSCRASELLVPVAGLDKAALIAQVEAMQPAGWTPIAYSLEQAAADFQPGDDSITNAIVLVTDGEETCDPPEQSCQAAAAVLHQRDITVHVVGFALTPQQTELVRCVAEQGGGQLFGADDAPQLDSAVGSAIAATGVDLTPPPTATPEATVTTIAAGECRWDGTWGTSYGTMRLTQSDTTVSGDYEHDQGQIRGTVSGQVLSGTWDEAPSRRPPDDAGQIEFTLADDCQSFTGRWRYDASGEWQPGWDGQLIAGPESTVTQVPTVPPTTTPVPPTATTVPPTATPVPPTWTPVPPPTATVVPPTTTPIPPTTTPVPTSIPDPAQATITAQAARIATLEATTPLTPTATVSPPAEPEPPGVVAPTLQDVCTVAGTATGITYAEAVVAYDPRNPAGPIAEPGPEFGDPQRALGPPDADPVSFLGALSLGSGGSLTVQFGDTALVGDGTAAPELWVCEVGPPDAEGAVVAVSADGLTWLELGRVGGGTSALDLDALGPGAAGVRFVRLTDDPVADPASFGSPGLDLDAVGAIVTAAGAGPSGTPLPGTAGPPPPEPDRPATPALPGTALAGDFVTPDPAECTTTPRTAEELATLAASPDQAAVDALATASLDPALSIPEGTPADAATVAAVTETYRQMIACFNAGHDLAAYALWTDAALRQIQAAPPASAPTPVPEGARSAFRVREVRLQPDGQVVAVWEQHDPAFTTTLVQRLVRQDKRYLINETVDALFGANSDVTSVPQPATPEATNPPTPSVPPTAPPVTATVLPDSTALPEGFVGHWEGTATWETAPLPVTMDLTAGRIGEVVGTIDYALYGSTGPTCGGEVSLESVAADGQQIALVGTITHDPSVCLVDATVTVSLQADGAFTYDWRHPFFDVSGTGTLRHSSPTT
jgi:Mg-chelatase subunit ChlD